MTSPLHRAYVTALLAALAACASQPPPAPRVIARAPADVAPGRQSWFGADAMDQMHAAQAAGGYLVAVVRCRSAEIALRGTRSEQVRIVADVLAVGTGPRETSVELVRYTRGDTVMAPGYAYLIGALASSRLVEAIAVDPARAEQIANDAAREVRAHAPYAP